MRTLLITLGLAVTLAVPCFAQITSTTVKVRKDVEQGLFVARYPKLTGETVAEKVAVGRINNTIKNSVHEVYKQAWLNWQKEAEDSTTGYMSKDIDFDITYEDSKIFSVNFTHTFAQGDEQPLFLKDGMTFSKLTGKLLSWKDLVRPEDKALMHKDHINTILLKGADRGDYSLYMGFEGIDKLPDNYYVDNTGTIHLQFNPGNLGPFTSGVIDVDTNCSTTDNLKK